MLGGPESVSLIEGRLRKLCSTAVQKKKKGKKGQLVVLLYIVATICLSLAKNLQLILGISATYRLFTNLLAD